MSGAGSVGQDAGIGHAYGSPLPVALTPQDCLGSWSGVLCVVPSKQNRELEWPVGFHAHIFQ